MNTSKMRLEYLYEDISLGALRFRAIQKGVAVQGRICFDVLENRFDAGHSGYRTAFLSNRDVVSQFVKAKWEGAIHDNSDIVIDEEDFDSPS